MVYALKLGSGSEKECENWGILVLIVICWFGHFDKWELFFCKLLTAFAWCRYDWGFLLTPASSWLEFSSASHFSLIKILILDHICFSNKSLFWFTVETLFSTFCRNLLVVIPTWSCSLFIHCAGFGCLEFYYNVQVLNNWAGFGCLDSQNPNVSTKSPTS